MRSVEDELSEEYVRAELDGRQRPILKYVQDMATGKYSFRENGAQRAERRARLKGLTVGAPVRAEIGLGQFRPQLVARDGNTFDLSDGAPPLDFGTRLTNYRLQVATRDHCLTGRRWQPTARQRRRLNHKARAANVRHYLAGKAEERAYALAHGDAYYAAMSDAPATVAIEPQRGQLYVEVAGGALEPIGTVPAKPDRERSAINPSGFRVVDRRGEHRS